MRKVFSLLKRYFSEILFVFVSALTIAFAIRGVLCYTGWLSAGVVVLAAVLQVIFGTCIQQSSNVKSILRMPITVGFIYFSAFFVLVISCSIAAMNLYGEIGAIAVLLANSLALRWHFFSKEKNSGDKQCLTQKNK